MTREARVPVIARLSGNERLFAKLQFLLQVNGYDVRRLRLYDKK